MLFIRVEQITDRLQQQIKTKPNSTMLTDVQEISKITMMATSLLKHGDCQRARAILIEILLYLQECEGDDSDYDGYISESEDDDDESMQEEEATTRHSQSSETLPNFIMDRTTPLEAQTRVRNWLEVTSVHVVPSSIYNRTWQIPLGCSDTTRLAAVILFNLALIDHRAALFSNTVTEQTRILQDALRCYQEAHDLLQDTDETSCDCFWVLLLRSALCFNMLHIYSTIGNLSMSYLLILELQTIHARLHPDSIHQYHHHHHCNHSSNPQDSQTDVDVNFLKQVFDGLRINI
jgi:hypothetical protein